jgi:hypothetical protein
VQSPVRHNLSSCCYLSDSARHGNIRRNSVVAEFPSPERLLLSLVSAGLDSSEGNASGMLGTLFSRYCTGPSQLPIRSGVAHAAHLAMLSEAHVRDRFDPSDGHSFTLTFGSSVSLPFMPPTARQVRDRSKVRPDASKRDGPCLTGPCSLSESRLTNAKLLTRNEHYNQASRRLSVTTTRSDGTRR